MDSRERGRRDLASGGVGGTGEMKGDFNFKGLVLFRFRLVFYIFILKYK